jgi:hypothetical protein
MTSFETKWTFAASWLCGADSHKMELASLPCGPWCGMARFQGLKPPKSGPPRAKPQRSWYCHYKSRLLVVASDNECISYRVGFADVTLLFLNRKITF